MDAHIVELTETDFDDRTAQQSGVVLFYKANCPFCKTLEAVLDKFARANPEVPLFRADFERYESLSKRFEVVRAPTLLLLKGGQVAVRKTGLMNPRELTALYQQAQS